MKKLAGALAFCLAFGMLATSNANAVYTDRDNLPSRQYMQMEYAKMTANSSKPTTKKPAKKKLIEESVLHPEKNKWLLGGGQSPPCKHGIAQAVLFCRN